jgi:hypothetical protein
MNNLCIYKVNLVDSPSVGTLANQDGGGVITLNQHSVIVVTSHCKVLNSFEHKFCVFFD